jgi:octaprenyl-diphosphate synthase
LAHSTPQAPAIDTTGSLANKLIEDSLKPVKEHLDELGKRLSSYVPTDTNSGRSVLEYIFQSGGKRIRPALYFLACRMLGYQGDHFYSIAAVGEFVHTASLLHDDVVDDSTIRRGKPTANTTWGDQSSVLVGDLIYSTASEMMAATGSLEVVKTFARAIRMMSDGELLQLESVYKGDLPEATYMKILESKTAILIGAVCKSAGLVAGASEEVCERLRIFGHNVGMAFQLIDDALDYTGTDEGMGKNTLQDLQEGKVTMPVILCLRQCDTEERAQILEICSKNTITRQDVAVVATLVAKYETAEQTVVKANEFTTTALLNLHAFPPSKYRDDMENLANKLLFRFT